MQLLWLDINVANCLCYGGVCLYKVVEGSGVTHNWIVENVTPNFASAFCNEVAVILGKALLWACFEPSIVGVVPDDISRRKNVMASPIQLNTTIVVHANDGAGIAVDDGAILFAKLKGLQVKQVGK